ncbi:MAG: hypothetical protein ACI9C4_003132 [Paraglaciecola sp.]|jgi:hypothetical protein
MKRNGLFADEIAVNIKQERSSGATELRREALTDLFTYAELLRT